MTTDQTDRAEGLRMRAIALDLELNQLRGELDPDSTDKPNVAILEIACTSSATIANALLHIVDRSLLPRQRAATINPFDSLHAAVCTTSRDMGETKLDAWIYGVVVGWDTAMAELAAKYGWSEETCARLRHLHEAFNNQKELHKS
jgi:hypothetical protein